MTDSEVRSTLVIVPFYDRLDLIEKQVANLIKLAEELIAGRFELLLINDYPKGTEVSERLVSANRSFEQHGITSTCMTNQRNLGFVASVNHGLLYAIKSNKDVVLLNSDAFPEPGCLTNMRNIAYRDEKIGFTGPRSNNATLSCLPWWSSSRNVEYATTKVYFEALRLHLPEFQYVPVLTGFCIFIKLQVLHDVGILDEAYSPGYNEENDLILRANRIGYRAALVNTALAHHLGSASFVADTSIFDDRHAKLLNHRFPEYKSTLEAYFQSLERKYEVLATELISAKINKPRILLDLRLLRCFHNGTFKLAIELTKAIVAIALESHDFELGVLIHRDAMEFHHLTETLDSIQKFASSRDVYHPYTISVLLAQPFTWDILTEHADLAPINVFLILDTIVADCYYLSSDNLDIQQINNFAALNATALGFISEFSQKEFLLRYGGNVQRTDFVLYPSLKLEDYFRVAPSRERRKSRRGFREVLIIGNHYHHKMVDSTSRSIASRFPDVTVHALGYRGDAFPGVIPYSAGNLPKGEIDHLFRRVDAVVFPSNYEGFGFPIPESIALNKPLLLRDLEVNREVFNLLTPGLSRKVQFYSRDSEMLDCLEVILHELHADDVLTAETIANGHAYVPSPYTGWHVQASILLTELTKLVHNPEPSLFQLRTRLMQISSMHGFSRDVHRALIGLEIRSSDLKFQLQELRESDSWRVTAPLRLLSRAMKRIIRNGHEKMA